MIFKMIKVRGFAAQLNQMKPKIEALGFFNVNKHLFPAVWISYILEIIKWLILNTF